MAATWFNTITGPITANTPVGIQSIATQSTTIIPAGECLIRLCFFLPHGTAVTSGCNITVGTLASPSLYVSSTDAWSTDVLNSGWAISKSFPSFVASSTDTEIYVSFDNDISNEVIWCEMYLTQNQQ